MNIIQLAKEGLDLIQQVQPGLDAAATATASLGTLGAAAVKLLQKGHKLYTYLIGKMPEKEASPDEAIQIKTNVAILVDINRRMLHDVARYLDEKGIDANLIIVTNDPTYGDKVRFLSHEPEAWIELVQEFNTAIGIIKRTVGKANLHIFLSAPLPLVFGLGAVWGTVDKGTVYHWDGETYHPTMPISRHLRDKVVD